MSSHAVRTMVLLVAALFACGCAGAARLREPQTAFDTARANSAHVSLEDARVITITLWRGSCWGTNESSLSIDRTKRGLSDPLDLWPRAASLIETGIAYSAPRRPSDTCYGRPNYSCAFRIDVDGSVFDGCCRDADARRIEDAYGLLAPYAERDEQIR